MSENHSNTLNNTCLGVRCIIVSEFNIDTGNELIAQYPPLSMDDFEEYSCISDYMLPEGCHNMEYDWNIFKLVKKSAIRKHEIEEGWSFIEEDPRSEKLLRSYNEELTPKDILYCLNLVHTRRDSTLRRGAKCRALSICCPHTHFQMYKFIMWDHFEKLFTVEKGPLLLERMEALYHKICLPKLSNALEFKVSKQDFFNYFNGKQEIQMPLENKDGDTMFLPLHYLQDETDDTSILTLLDTFKENIMLIYDALLLDKPVLFHGHNIPNWVICRYVLSALLLCHPIGSMEAKVFPFVHLASISFQHVKGFIAGCNNPMFQEGEFEWELFCDISTGKIIDKSKSRISHHDTSFIKKLMGESSCGEGWIREQFQLYTQSLIDDALNDNRESPNYPKIQKWRSSDSHRLFLEKKYLILTERTELYASMKRIKNSKPGEDLSQNVKAFFKLIRASKLQVSEIVDIAGSYKVDFQEIQRRLISCSEETRQQILHINADLRQMLSKVYRGMTL